MQTDHQRPDQEIINKKSQIVDFAVIVDHRVKIKENGKRDKYLVSKGL